MNNDKPQQNDIETALEKAVQNVLRAAEILAQAMTEEEFKETKPEETKHKGKKDK